ncbi:MAG TPA: hypothetical protein VFV65_04680 [Gemmatimonadales bacterium]|nr:hypothetical protein [Gemmatimonadales bacterium]
MPFRAVVSVILLAAYLPACTAYHATSTPLAELTTPPNPVGRVCVTKFSGAQVEVLQPRVAHDTLFGMNGARGMATSGVAIALSDIKSTEIRKLDGGKTLVAVLVIGGVMVLAGLGMKTLSDDMWDGYSFGM